MGSELVETLQTQLEMIQSLSEISGTHTASLKAIAETLSSINQRLAALEEAKDA